MASNTTRDLPGGAGFSVFALDNPRAARTIAKKLAERRADLVETIANNGATDWAHYKEMIGLVRGLDEALQICGDVQKLEEN